MSLVVEIPPFELVAVAPSFDDPPPADVDIAVAAVVDELPPALVALAPPTLPPVVELPGVVLDSMPEAAGSLLLLFLSD